MLIGHLSIFFCELSVWISRPFCFKWLLALINCRNSFISWISGLCQMFHKYLLPICSLSIGFLDCFFQPNHQYFIILLLKYIYRKVHKHKCTACLIFTSCTHPESNLRNSTSISPETPLLPPFNHYLPAKVIIILTSKNID